MPTQRIYKRILEWTQRSLSVFGIFVLVGLVVVQFVDEYRFADDARAGKSHVNRRSVGGGEMVESIVHVQTGAVIDNTKKEERRLFESLKQERAYVQFQFPSEKFVPLDRLATVYLNGIRFYVQGDQILPSKDEDEEGPLKARTRSNNDNLRCEGRNDFKAYKKGLATTAETTTEKVFMANDVQAVVESSMEAAEATEDSSVESTSTDKSTGKSKIDNDDVVEAGDDEAPSTDTDSSVFDDDSARSVVDLSLAAELMAYFDDETTTNGDTTSSPTAPPVTNSTTSTEAVKNHRIGCCNGVPYNQNKRCCCRRIAFDKDKKFCCAVNGCENFHVFDRSNPKHFDLCKSLQGLVVKEYGYTGAYAAMGEPDLTLAPRRSRPSV